MMNRVTVFSLLFYLLRADFLASRFFQEMMLEPLAAMTGQRKFFLSYLESKML